MGNKGPVWTTINVKVSDESTVSMNVMKDNGGKITNLTVTRLAIFLAELGIETEAKVAAAYREGLEDGASCKTSALKAGAL